MRRPPVPEPGAAALFLDIDGTLVEHAPHPDGVRVAPGLPEILGALDRRLDGAVAFVTGRNLAMVDRLFAGLGLAAAATFGVERVLGTVREDGKDEAARVRPVFAALAARLAHRTGVYFEDKGPVLAIHSRAEPEALPEVVQACREALADLPEGYRMLEGHAGVELLPESATKAAALAWFMERPPFAGRVPVFLGDDTADESGFDWVNRNDGVSVRVRPQGPTLARHVLADVDEVHDWLAELADADGPRRAAR
ncbi:MAG: trehalose-phosphatase [Rhodobacteraceae bacterium]|jgi:trehalose 6-phosphate phosphatase|nr:trehalose-phosphatase [Paracoccaceae bacterium]